MHVPHMTQISSDMMIKCIDCVTRVVCSSASRAEGWTHESLVLGKKEFEVERELEVRALVITLAALRGITTALRICKALVQCCLQTCLLTRIYLNHHRLEIDG